MIVWWSCCFQVWNFDMGDLRWSERRVYSQEVRCLHEIENPPPCIAIEFMFIRRVYLVGFHDKVCRGIGKGLRGKYHCAITSNWSMCGPFGMSGWIFHSWDISTWWDGVSSTLLGYVGGLIVSIETDAFKMRWWHDERRHGMAKCPYSENPRHMEGNVWMGSLWAKKVLPTNANVSHCKLWGFV